jgi:hypothetical protein
MLIMQLHPHAATYTYVNADCVTNGLFVETANALKELSRPFIAVGRRTNLLWKPDLRCANITHPSIFEQLMRKGELGRTSAMDYFITSKDVWDWSKIPDFVVGRPGFDTWLAGASPKFRLGACSNVCI